MTEEGFHDFIQKFAFINGTFVTDPIRKSYTFITHQFVHGDFTHIIGNVWYLWIFGKGVEAKLGSMKFLLFFLFSGVFSCMSQLIVMPNLSAPLLGASGSISGILGAYFVFFPKAKIATWLPPFTLWWTIKIRAILFLGLWITYQFVIGYHSLGVLSSMEVNTAWWAHIGGFLFGLFFALNIK
ncbi:rhomboid family intramembrane serine protease [Elusimicrobiota bacterium]